MSRMTLAFVAALTVCAMAAAMVTESAEAAAGAGNSKWGKRDDKKKDDKKKDKEDVQAKDIERLSAAAEAVEKEETEVQNALAEAEAEAAKKAGDDAAQQARLVMSARRKAVAALETCGVKYGRVLAAAQPIATKADLTDKSKAALQTLAAKVNMLRRGNVERIADLYEKMGKDRQALAVLEAYYGSLPESQRFAAMSIKERIDALKEKTSPKRKAAAAP